MGDLAYKVLDFPHLGLRLVPGRCYSRVELEQRCRTKSDAATFVRKLRAKLKDRALFEPVTLQDVVSEHEPRASRGKKRRIQEALPKWSRGPVSSPDGGGLSVVTKKRRVVANGMAGGLLKSLQADGRKVSDSDVLVVLRAWGFRRNTSRLNVIPEGQDFVHSDTLGMSATRGGGVCMSAASRNFPHVTRLLLRWLEDNRPSSVPENFPVTSISVNWNYAARRHRDCNNAGPSVIKAFGNFTGGELRYWPKDDSSCDVEALRARDAVSLNVAGSCRVFDGLRAHEVRPFKGERFTLVFFSVGKYAKSGAKTRKLAQSLGFRVPTETSLRCAWGSLGRSSEAAPRASPSPARVGRNAKRHKRG